MGEVSVMAVRALVTAVEGAGVQRERFLAEAGLSAASIADPDARVTLEEYARVRITALAMSGDPAFGLRMGAETSFGSHDVLGYVAEHASSLREALQVAARYGRIVMEGPKLELSEQGERAILRCTQLTGEAPEVRLTAEFVTSALLRLVRRFAGNDVLPMHVYFAYARPAHAAQYERTFADRARFAHAFTGMEIERSWLDRSHAHSSPALSAVLRTRAELLLARVQHEASASERVAHWLAAQSADVRPTMDDVARELGTSIRSLRRRLNGEGTSYARLVEQTSATRAKELLSDTSSSITEVAYALGFNDPAAFSRAFKRWTGGAPSAYRAGRSSE